MYTNTQMVVFCEMLGIENKTNPTPVIAGIAERRGAEDWSGPAVDDRTAFPPLGGASFPPLEATPPGRGGGWMGGARGVGPAPVARETRHAPTLTEDVFPPLGVATVARGRGWGSGCGQGLG